MNSDTKKDLSVGLFFMVLSIAYMIGTTTISTFTPFGNRGLDSRSVPLLLGMLMFVLSAVFTVTVVFKEFTRKNRLSDDTENDNTEESGGIGGANAESSKPSGDEHRRIVNPIRLIVSFLSLAIYVAMYRRLGFVISSTFLLVVQSFLLVKDDERKRWRVVIPIFAIGVSVLIYFVFTRYLSLFLPKGILG